MREQLSNALKEAMRSKDQMRLATLRLISAAIKDRDIQGRSETDDGGVGEAEILELLATMVKQREESIKLYEEGGRLDLAERERAELAIIREFMPAPMSDAEIDAAVAAALEKLDAKGIRDMGRVMAELKGAYAGRMDFAVAGAKVKAALAD